MSFQVRNLAILSLVAVVMAAGCTKKQGQSVDTGVAGVSSLSAAVAPAASSPSVPLSKGAAQVAHTAQTSVPGTGILAADGIKKIVEAEKPAAPDCFTISFRHKKTAGHSSDEDCSRHKNTVRLPHSNVNAQSLCVRVNGRPVSFQLSKAGEVTFGSQAGPEATVVTKYCLGKVRCAEDCKVPRDEFMEALGGMGAESEQAGKWDSSDGHARDLAAAKVDSEIRKEMAEMEDGVDVFRGWISADGAGVFACVSESKQLAVKHK